MSNWFDEQKEKINELIYETLEKFIETADLDIDAIWDQAHKRSQFTWRAISSGLAFTGGATVTFIPNVVGPLVPGPGWVAWAAGNGAAVGVDIWALFTGMARSAYGIGAILANEQGLNAMVIDKYDFVDILCVWVKSPSLVQDAHAKAVLTANYPVAKASAKANAKASAKAAAKAAAKGGVKAAVSFKATGILTPVIGYPLAKKIGGKIGAKTASVIPFAGPVINGGINGWFVNEICAAAETYYKAKLGI